MNRAPPNREQLLEYARRFARELHGVEPPEADLAERIDYVLWGRKQAWACLEAGIITAAELRDLLIDHFDYECAHLSGRAWPDYDEGDRRRFEQLLEQVLYG